MSPPLPLFAHAADTKFGNLSSLSARGASFRETFFLSRESKKEQCDRDCPCQKEEEGTAEEKGRKEIHPPPPPLSSSSSPPPPPTSSKKPIVENRAKGASPPPFRLFCCPAKKSPSAWKGRTERGEEPPPPLPPLRWRWPLWPRRLQEERKRGRGVHLLGGKRGLAQWVLFVLSAARVGAKGAGRRQPPSPSMEAPDRGKKWP